MSTSSYYFTIIGTKDNPLYELEFSSFKNLPNISSSQTSISSPNSNSNSNATKKNDVYIPGKSQFSNSTKELLPFIANSSLDLIEDQCWNNNVLNLGKIDQFYGLSINAYITQGSIKFIICYDSTKDENTSIKQFFQEINELYAKILLNPFYNINDAIISPDFDFKVKQYARKYL